MMKKKWLIMLLAFVFCLFAAMPVSAASSRLNDEADLLSDGEEQAILSMLDEVSARQEMDIVIVTKTDIYQYSPMEFADDYYDEHGYRPDGILLLIDMGDGEWWVSTAGYGITAVTDAGLDYISERFVPYLSDGDFTTAFTTFIEDCDQFITQAKTGKPYDYGNLPKGKFPVVNRLLVSFVIGFIAALIVTGIMKGKLKSVHAQAGAREYVRPGSLQITGGRDLFLYSRVTRRPREQSSSSGGSSTHRSSSGRTHGGGGGRF